MANRHLSRSIALQTLFEWDFRGCKNELLPEILERNMAEFGPGLENDSFTPELVNLVSKKRKTLDGIIEKAAPEWPLDKISAVDRAVLRLGLAELLFGDRSQVPPKVAINEAIELAKTFGGDSSSKFVNGVLGAIYKEIGEPGKEETSKHKPKETDPNNLPLERLGGAVVYARTAEGLKLALVHDVFGYWTLSKGKLEGEENEIEGALREIKEEIGLDIIIKNKLGENEYVASHPEKGRTRKHVVYYLAEAVYGPLQLAQSGGLDDARWFPLAQVADLKIYDDILPIITNALKILNPQS